MFSGSVSMRPSPCVAQRRRELGVGEQRLHVVQPLGLADEALLHVQRHGQHVELRVARVELDDDLLAVLLLGHGLGADLDPGELGEFLLVRAQHVGARPEGQRHLDALPGEAPPVEGAAGLGRRDLHDRGRGEQAGSGA
jgi:hypothetical protein